MMKVVFKEIVDTSSTLFQNSIPNYYEVLVFGKKTLLEYWNGWHDKLPDPVCEVTANLTGRMKVSGEKDYNNLTLIHKSIKYIYE